jgi:hypothetical protein
MAEKPWWRRLDGQPPSPQWWERSPSARVGFIGTIIFGGGFVLRLVFQLGMEWLFALLTAPFVVLLAVGVYRSRA